MTTKRALFSGIYAIAPFQLLGGLFLIAPILFGPVQEWQMPRNRAIAIILGIVLAITAFYVLSIVRKGMDTGSKSLASAMWAAMGVAGVAVHLESPHFGFGPLFIGIFALLVSVMIYVDHSAQRRRALSAD